MTLTYAIKEGFAYERRIARGTQSPLHTLASRRGSCRDFATLMMEAARSLGLAARFVSGYLYVPDRDSGDAEPGRRLDARLVPGLSAGRGWVEFDPTNGIVGSRDLIRVAVARDARQAFRFHGSYYRRSSRRRQNGVSVVVRALPESRVRSESQFAPRAVRAGGSAEPMTATLRLHGSPSALARASAHLGRKVAGMLIEAGFAIGFECPSIDADASATQHPSLAVGGFAQARLHRLRSRICRSAPYRRLRQSRYAAGGSAGRRHVPQSVL